MARTIGNNIYYEEESPTTSLFKTGVLAAGGIAAFKFRKNILDAVYPIQRPILSDYEKSIFKTSETMSGFKARAESIRRTRDGIFHNRQSPILETPGVEINKISPLSASDPDVHRAIIGGNGHPGAAGTDLKWNNIDEVTDAAGNPIGRRVQKALAKYLGEESIADPVFNGTVARFKVGTADTIIDIPFAKYDTKLGAEFVSTFGTSEAAPVMADIENLSKEAGVFDPGLVIKDWNTNMLNVLEDEDRAATYLMDAMTDFDKIDNVKISAGIEKIAERQIALSMIRENNNAHTVNSIIRSMKRDLQFTNPLDPHKTAMVSSQVNISLHSRHKAADAVPGLDQLQIGSRTIGVSRSDKKYMTEEALKVMYADLPRNVRDGKFRFISSTGNMSIDDAMSMRGGRRIIDGMGHFAATAGQEHTAAGMFTIRPTHFAKQAELQKSEKSLMYHVSQRDLKNLNKRYLRGNVSADRLSALERLRFMPVSFDPSITPLEGSYTAPGRLKFKSVGGYEGALAETYERGSLNMLANLDPFTEETIAFAKYQYRPSKNGKVKTKKVSDILTASYQTSHEVDGLISAPENLEEALAQKLDVTYHIGNERLRRPLSALINDKALQQRMIDTPGAYISYSKGSILGTKKATMDIKSAEDLEALIKHPDKIVTASTHGYIRRDHILKTIKSQIDGSEAVKGTDKAISMRIFSEEMEAASKVGVMGSLTRGSVNVGITREVETMMQRAARVSPEMSISTKIYEKVVPKMLTTMEVPKGHAEFLQFMQNSIAGHIMTYENEYVTLRDEALEKIKPYINFADDLVEDGGLNLTKLMKEGKLSWSGIATGGKEDVAKQLYNMAGLLGKMRSGYISNGNVHGPKNITIGKLRDRDTRLFHKYWDTYSSLNFEDMTGVQSVKDARRKTWGWWGGINPVETLIKSQGRGFNQMTIGSKEMPHMNATLGNILSELSMWNINDSRSNAYQTMLLEASWNKNAGERTAHLDQLVSKYEKYHNTKINSYSIEDFYKVFADESLQNAGGKILQENLKNSKFSMETFLNMDNNRFGFWVEVGDSKRFVPGAEFLGGLYVHSGEDGSLGEFAHKFVKSLGEYTATQSDADRANIHKLILANAASSTEGFSSKMGMSIADSKYLANVEDTDFLHNIGLQKKLRSVGSDRLHTLLGGITVQSKSDFTAQFEQLISNVYETARTEGSRSIESKVVELFGEDNALLKNSGNIFKGYNIEDIERVGARTFAKQLTDAHIENAKSFKSLIGTIADSGGATADQLSEVEKLMGNMMGSLSVRYPNVYVGSASPSFVMPDTTGNIKQGQVAQSRLLNILQRGDFDGDKVMTKWFLTAKSKQEAMDRLHYANTELRSWMDFRKKSAMSNIIKTIGEGSENKGSVLKGYELLADVMHSGQTEFATSAASFMTKSMTGALSIKSLQMRNVIRAQYGPLDLSNKLFTQAEAYFGTVSSAFIEQEAISSKHSSFILDIMNNIATGKIKDTTSLLGATFAEGPEKIRASIAATGLNPHIMLATTRLNQHQNIRNVAGVAELESHIKVYADTMTHFRQRSDEEIDAMARYFWKDGAERDKVINAFKQGFADRPAFLDTEAGQKMFNSDDTFVDVLGRVLISKEEGGASDDIVSLIKSVAKLNDMKGKSQAEILDEVSKRIFTNKRHLAETMGILTELDLYGYGNEKRMLRGLPRMQKFFNEQVIAHPVRSLGILAGGLLAMRVLNITSGDGAPYDPEDLPSYGNPSFETKSSMMNIHPRTIANMPDFNTDASLLTDNTMSHDDSIAYARSRGYTGNRGNSVSIRHDGHNPYSSDMMLYG